MPVEHVERTIEPADSELVGRAAAGDAQAFDLLFQRHFPRIYNFAHRLTNDREDAQDIAQQAFVRTYGALKRIRDAQSFQKFVYQTTANLARDRARRRSRKPWISFGSLLGKPSDEAGTQAEADFADVAQDPFETALGVTRSDALEQAIQRLPQEFREVVVLHHLQDMDIVDVAAVLGIPEGTAKSRLGRARQRLRSMLRPWFDGEAER